MSNVFQSFFIQNFFPSNMRFFQLMFLFNSLTAFDEYICPLKRVFAGAIAPSIKQKSRKIFQKVDKICHKNDYIKLRI